MLSLGGGVPHACRMPLSRTLLAGVYSGAKLLRTERGDTVRFDLLMLLIAIPLSCWQIKLLPYATYLAGAADRRVAGAAAGDGRSPAAQHAALPLIAAAVLLVVVGVAAGWLLTAAPASTNRVKEALEQVQDCRPTPRSRRSPRCPPGSPSPTSTSGPTSWR